MGPPKQGWLAAAAWHRRRLPLVAGLITAAALFGMLLWLAPGGVPGGSLNIRALVQGRTNDSGYRSAAAAALLPALVRREEQLALERRWGVQPVLEPQQGWGPPGIKIPRILHHGGQAMDGERFNIDLCGSCWALLAQPTANCLPPASTRSAWLINHRCPHPSSLSAHLPGCCTCSVLPKHLSLYVCGGQPRLQRPRGAAAVVPCHAPRMAIYILGLGGRHQAGRHGEMQDVHENGLLGLLVAVGLLLCCRCCHGSEQHSAVFRKGQHTLAPACLPVCCAVLP